MEIKQSNKLNNSRKSSTALNMKPNPRRCTEQEIKSTSTIKEVSHKKHSILKDGKKNEEKMKNFLKDLKNFSEKENYVTKKILKTLDQESKSSKFESDEKIDLGTIMFTKTEIKEYANQYNQNIKKFYTYSQSGKQYFQKSLKNNMKEI